MSSVQIVECFNLLWIDTAEKICMHVQLRKYSGKNLCLCRWRENSCNIFPNGMCIFPPLVYRVRIYICVTNSVS